ncbi:MAG: hypothetical protein QOK43_1977 [Acidimicrobiaceae bacterium]|nr:hypothetical protein [Acidimicrobiaceae bacterium]
MTRTTGHGPRGSSADRDTSGADDKSTAAVTSPAGEPTDPEPQGVISTDPFAAQFLFTAAPAVDPASVVSWRGSGCSVSFEELPGELELLTPSRITAILRSMGQLGTRFSVGINPLHRELHIIGREDSDPDQLTSFTNEFVGRVRRYFAYLAKQQEVLDNKRSDNKMESSSDPPPFAEVFQADIAASAEVIDTLSQHGLQPDDLLSGLAHRRLPLEESERLRGLFLARLGAKMAVQEQLRDDIDNLGRAARMLGATWTALGDAAGISNQAAYQRWSPDGKAKARDKQRRRRAAASNPPDTEA